MPFYVIVFLTLLHLNDPIQYSIQRPSRTKVEMTMLLFPSEKVCRKIVEQQSKVTLRIADWVDHGRYPAVALRQAQLGFKAWNHLAEAACRDFDSCCSEEEYLNDPPDQRTPALYNALVLIAPQLTHLLRSLNLVHD